MITIEYYKPGQKRPSETWQKPNWAIAKSFHDELVHKRGYKMGKFKMRQPAKKERKKTVHEKLFPEKYNKT